MTSPRSPPTFAAFADGQSKSGRVGRGLAVAACPAPPRRIPAVHVPCVAHGYKSRRRDPGELPTLAALGESLPCPPTDPPEKEKLRGEKEDLESSVGAPSAAKTGAARGRSRTRRRRAHLPPLLPLLPRRHAAAAFIFLPTDEPRHRTSPTPARRPVATKVRTNTSLPLWTPRPSSRGGTCHRTAPLRRRRW
jgi:hypothetical protein